MSLLLDYEARTAWKYEPVCGFFSTDEGLKRKVSEDGSYLPFPGSTAVFRPGKTCLQVMMLIQRILYEQLGDTGMLAEPLPASTIHMTLHDLISPETSKSDPADQERFIHEAGSSLRGAAGIVEEIRTQFAGRKIAMAADRIVRMASKSLVMMLKPGSEQDFELLAELYRRFEELQPLPYPMTPHITLAYFRPGRIDGDRLGETLDRIQVRPETAPVLEFDTEALTTQKFLDMKTYADVPVRLCLCCDGGLNRSVMAANILNHLARKRDLPVTAEARSAYENTQGRPVPEDVRKTLERHGIETDGLQTVSRCLESCEFSHFTAFAAISAGAMSRLSWMRIPEERVNRVSGFFYGVRDPEYGEISHEQAFTELYERAERYLDAFEKEF